MTKYRKLPIVIEAVQILAYTEFLPGSSLSVWMGGLGIPSQDVSGPAYLLIPTLEGPMRADIGDWIIKGVNGEFYPCKDEIFRKTYEEVK